MSLADDIEDTVNWSVGSTLGKGIMDGCYRHIGVRRDELRKEDLDAVIRSLESSLPLFVGTSAASGVIEKIKQRFKEAA